MIAEREALRMGIEHLTVLFPTEVSSFDFQFECTDRTVQYKLNAQSLRLFGLHRDVNDAHRAGANRLQNKTKPRIQDPFHLFQQHDCGGSTCVGPSQLQPAYLWFSHRLQASRADPAALVSRALGGGHTAPS